MKREIIFRAWDKENNCFFVPTYEAYKGNLSDLLIGLSGDLFLHTIRGTEHESLFPERFELMQFTGLKDMNGKEIYEGDIVKTNVSVCINRDEVKKAGGDLFVIPEFEKQDRYCQIDWYNGVRVSGWRLLGKDKRYQTQLKWSTIGNMKIEVIGNIYENPELLK